ncbi:MAG: RAMP superfamily protein, partial [Cyanobacteriota bacterium]|nr:RAMP superfamily protein [Cyanobacteriota bacterium]
MVKIPDAANKIPMMFRAQTAGRCQLQRIDTQRTRNKEKQDVELWASEWIEKSYQNPPQFGEGVETSTYQINWRFVTNGGQDDGIIRPVIGAYGWPYYPGSSMKGIFQSACTPEQSQRYCGRETKKGDWEPGVLRFHGGYPTNEDWQENLVDIVHPQQPWQVGMEDNKSAGAFALISLYQPQLVFGISATQPVDWDEVWKIWETALSKGIGCRVSTGYGQSKNSPEKPLYSTVLKGQGMAPKLLNGEGEFRPNIFRGAIRGHALRIFGGLTNADQAVELVETLFGGVQGQGSVGLLGMNFQEKSLEINPFGRGSYEVPAYNVEGKLNWILT